MNKITQEDLYNFLLKHRGKKYTIKSLCIELDITFHAASYGLKILHNHHEVKRELITPKNELQRGRGVYFLYWIDNSILKEGNESITSLYKEMDEKIIEMKRTAEDMQNIIDRIKEKRI